MSEGKRTAKQQERMSSGKREDERRFQVSRRGFLGYMAGAGFAAGFGSLLGACGSDGTSSGNNSPGESTEEWKLQFDLSYLEPTHAFTLYHSGNRSPLQPVTSQDLAEVRLQNPLLAAVPGENITHTCTVQFPTDQVIMYSVRAARNAERPEGIDYIAMVLLHIPKAYLRAATETVQAQQALANKLALCRGLSQGQNTSLSVLAAADSVEAESYKNPLSCAKALVFSHPNLMSLDPTSAATVKTAIGSQMETYKAGFVIQEQGENWASLQNVPDPTDTSRNASWNYTVPSGPLYPGFSGKPQAGWTVGKTINEPLQQNVWSQKTQMAVGGAIVAGVKQTRNNADLRVQMTPDVTDDQMQGKLYTWQEGQSHVSVPSSSAEAAFAGVSATASGGKGPYGWAVRNVSPQPGYDLAVKSYDDTSGTLELEIKNTFARYLQGNVSFLKPDGSKIDLGQTQVVTEGALDDDLIAKLTGDSTVQPFNFFKGAKLLYGVPLSYETKTFSVDPSAVSGVTPRYIEVVCTGLGESPFSAPGLTYAVPSIATGIMYLAIPMFFLASGASGAYEATMKSVEEVAEDLIKDMIKEALKVSFEIIEKAVEAKSFSDFIKAVGEICIGLMFKCAVVDAIIVAGIALGEAIDAIPLIGQAILAATAVDAGVDLAETSIELGLSPATYVNTLSAKIDIALTIKHDPDDNEFPATATQYEVLVNLDDGSSPMLFGPYTLPAGQSDSLQVVLQGVPYGGNILITAGFYSNTGWLAGSGSTNGGQYTENNALEQTITIKENLVPLSESTTYSFQAKVVADESGKPDWVEGGSAPTEDQDQLECTTGLCKLVGITVSETGGCVGFAWQASLDESYACVDPGQGTNLYHMFGSLSLTKGGDGFMASSCGFSEGTQIGYELLGLKNNVWLDPTGGTYMVRAVTVPSYSVETSPSYATSQAVGRFRLPSDIFMLHPAGQVISINTSFNKLEVLTPLPAPVDDADAPAATVYLAYGSRIGLLNAPVCGAVTQNGTIIVLEQGNQRLQAFDVCGNPVPHFKNGSCTAALSSLSKNTITFLDMAVETKGYIYILMYNNNSYSYFMDIYDPEGVYLARQGGIVAGKIAVDLWRNLYTLNYESIKTIYDIPNLYKMHLVQPSVSKWIPSTPGATARLRRNRKLA